MTLVHSLTSKAPASSPMRKLSRFMESTLLRRSDVIVANSRISRDHIAVMTKGRVPTHICSPGKDLPVASKVPAVSSGTVRLLTASHVTPLKGIDTLLEALSMLRDLDWNLTVAGDNTVDARHVRRLKKIIRREGMVDRVRFTGILTGYALSQTYMMADIFVFPTKYEAYGISLAEAMHLGLPYVASRVGGVKEITQNRGLLVDPGKVGALAHALRRMISDSRFREEQRRLSGELARDLPTWSDTGRCFSEIIASVIGKRGSMR